MKTIMKKTIFIAIIALASFGTLNAQDTTFGASAGYYNLTLKVSEGSISASTSASGFYVGLFADIEVGESFSIQPELQFLLMENQLTKSLYQSCLNTTSVMNLIFTQGHN